MKAERVKQEHGRCEAFPWLLSWGRSEDEWKVEVDVRRFHGGFGVRRCHRGVAVGEKLGKRSVASGTHGGECEGWFYGGFGGIMMAFWRCSGGGWSSLRWCGLEVLGRRWCTIVVVEDGTVVTLSCNARNHGRKVM